MSNIKFQSPNEIPISNDKSPHLVNGGEED